MPSMDLSPKPEDYILQGPVFNPIVPYITSIFGSLAPGKMVSIQGATPMEAERFQVDFQAGSSLAPRADIGLHFNPRFRSRPYTICNSLSNGLWMEEVKFPHLPLKSGDSFLLLFLFEQDHVKVSVNGQHYLQYMFSLPLDRMNTLRISGDVILRAIAFFPKNPFDIYRTEYPVAPHLFKIRAVLDVPLSHLLPESLRPRDTVTVRGLVCQDPKEFSLDDSSRFCISLKKDPSHVSFSFRVCFTDQTVSWRSFLDRGQESGGTVAEGFPFHPQRYFELLFLCQEDHLQLALNGTALGPPCIPHPATDAITELAVEGDVVLYSTQVRSSLPSCSAAALKIQR
ncbi:galectin-12 isoform X1 [Podarcis raffonei]|uniref:galectin-12 isoform X1 n=1 Tax=Podarcis raffonei TaxID=65483 RepID=UPI0023296B01|nr:galectin-12 isoform X1 [Podarcis raffonei]